jgi:hypothetical protein
VSIGTDLLECLIGREHDGFLVCSILRALPEPVYLNYRSTGWPRLRALRTQNLAAHCECRRSASAWTPVDAIHKPIRPAHSRPTTRQTKAPRSHPPADSRRASLSGKEYRYSHPPNAKCASGDLVPSESGFGVLHGDHDCDDHDDNQPGRLCAALRRAIGEGAAHAGQGGAAGNGSTASAANSRW